MHRLPSLNHQVPGTGIKKPTVSFHLPYGVSFSSLPDGPLPKHFSGTTWSVVSGAAKNSPILSGVELLTDPGLEATYTTGKCNSLSRAGASDPILAESADAHGGTKAQQFTGVVANNYLYWALRAGAAGVWNYFSVYAKRTLGTAGNTNVCLSQANSLPDGVQFVAITSDTYLQYKTSVISTDTSNIYRRPVYTQSSSNWDTVIVDDGSHQTINFSSLYSLLPPTQSDVVVKVQPSALVAGDATQFGIILRSNSDASNCIFVMYYQKANSPTIGNVAVVKKIGSTYSSVLVGTAITLAADVWLEVRASGSTIKVFYNNVQKGTDLTVSDAELINNKQHGIFSAGSNTLKGFYCTTGVSSMPIAWAGSSWTIGSYYSPRVQTWLISNINYLQYNFSFTNAARSGNNVWSNLVRLTREILASNPQVIILDHANGTVNNFTLEAFVRRVWTFNPAIKIILIETPTWNTLDYHNNDNVISPLNVDTMTAVNAVASHYEIPIIRVWEWAKTVVPDTYNLDTLFPDGVHPQGEGVYTYITNQIESTLTQGMTRYTSTLPTRVYNCQDYENESVIKNGTDYTSRTGTWTDTSTRTESSVAGSTITYTATCQSFGSYRADSGSNTVEISIDGGVFSSMTLYQNGVEVPSGRGSHTITIRIPTGGSCRIDEFWAI